MTHDVWFSIQIINIVENVTYVRAIEYGINVIKIDIFVLLKRRRLVIFLEPLIFEDLWNSDPLKQKIRNHSS